MYKFDLILVVAGKDFQYMDVKLKNIREFINPDIVYIISPRIDIEKNKYRILKNNNKVFMIDENDILDINNINFNNVQIPGMPQRRFWYYQQFLKMAFSYSKYSTKDYYLIWDADTIPLNPIIFFENKKIHLTINKEEYNEQYHNNIARLFGDIKMHHKSFISQHLFVKKSHMIELVEKLNKDWPTHIMKTLIGTRPSVFSEYETYANYVLNFHKQDYTIRELSWFRKGKYIVSDINKISILSDYYDFIAIEKSDNVLLKGIYFKVIHQINKLKKVVKRLKRGGLNA